ncbi:MAG: hypothetical protein IJ709_08570, partial [Selenomonas sp.]|nr:hypothetical protein [Selenomonas sp.]
LRVTGSLTAGQQIGLNGKNIQLSGAKLNNGANAKTTVAGESAVITGTITTDTGADLSVKAQNVIVGDAGITNIAVSKFTVEGVEQAKFINTNFRADTTVKGKAAVLNGNIDATGYELTLQSTNVTIGDGQTATVMTTESLADADNLTIDQAVLNLDSYKLQAGKAITLKNEVTAEGQALELAAPDASIGDGSANTVIKAGSVSATDKLLVDKAVLAVDDGTLQAQQIILRGNVTADNLDLTLQAPEAAIGDGIVDTVITARSVMGTEDLLIDKASFAVTNPMIATAGNLTLQHKIVAGDTVGFQAGKAITMQGMSMDKSTDVSFEGKLIDMRDSSIDAGKDGKLFFAAYSVKTESPLSYTFQPDNEVIIDNSRLDAGEMTMLGYSIITRNGSEIYADKTLDALAAKKVAMDKLGNLGIVSQATLSTEPQNKLLQQDAIIEVGGRAYHNFRFIPASAYQSDTIMRYLESVNEMPWQIGSDNSPLSIVGIPGLSLYRFQYQDGISDAISGLEMYFTVDSHEGEEREEKEMTNE